MQPYEHEGFGQSQQATSKAAAQTPIWTIDGNQDITELILMSNISAFLSKSYPKHENHALFDSHSWWNLLCE